MRASQKRQSEGVRHDYALRDYVITAPAKCKMLDLVSSLLFAEACQMSALIPLVQKAEGLWGSKSQCLLPPVENRSQQRVWDTVTGIFDKLYDDLFNMAQWRN